jgi:transcriptional regulator with XRE-family HTH domain
MTNENNQNSFQQNLRLLCGYSRSVSDICRRASISRPQFNKYLSGKSLPSIRSLRRICDHFGVEEWEIFLPYEQFYKLIAFRPPNSVLQNRSQKSLFESEIRKRSDSSGKLKSLLGYYYSYVVLKGPNSVILRSLVRLFEVDGTVFSITIEREQTDSSTKKLLSKYDGVVYSSGNRIFISERERYQGGTIWHTILYSTGVKREQYFSGLSLGSTATSLQNIVSYRVIFQYLETDVNLRQVLTKCGSYSLDSLEIPLYVRQRIENKIEEGDNAFIVAV